MGLITGVRNRVVRAARRTSKQASRSVATVSRRVERGWSAAAKSGRKWRQQVARVPRRLLRRAGKVTVPPVVARAFGRLDLTYGPPGEVTRCPICGSRAVQHLDPMWHYRKGTRRVAGFATGCRTCGVVFANPFPTRRSLDEFYGGPESEYVARRSERGDGREQRVGQRPPAPANAERPRENPRLQALFSSIQEHLDVVHPPAGAKVLDFGCGPGRMLDRLQALGWDTYGIEPAMKTAFSRHRELQAPPSHPTFDLIVVHHVLEHVANPLEILQSLSQALVPGGFLYISVPGLDGVATHGDLRYCINSHTHIVSFTRDCLRSLLVRAGLTPIDVRNDVELDRLLLRGERRQRLFARKLDAVPPPPARPLDAAVAALRAYYERYADVESPTMRVLPVRLRAAWMQQRLAAQLAARRQQAADAAVSSGE